MATIYNLTNATNSTSMYQIIDATNAASDGVAGTVLIWTMFIITFIGMKGWSNTDAFAATSFGFTVIAVLMFFANLLSEAMLMIFIALGAGSLFMLILKR